MPQWVGWFRHARPWLRLKAALASRGRRWSVAARHYRSFLKANPDSQPAWLQLGHACKEAGDRAGARAAYGKAVLLNPQDDEARRHLGAILTRDLPTAPLRVSIRGAPVGSAASETDEIEAGAWTWFPDEAAVRDASDAQCLVLLRDRLEVAWKDPAAQARLRSAFAKDPRFGGLLRIAPSTEEALEVNASCSPPVLLLDVSDLLNFVRDYGRVSGIQRVQIGLLSAVLAGKAAGRLFQHVRFCFSEAGWAWALDDHDLAMIADALASGAVDTSAAARLVDRARALAMLCDPPQGSAYLVLGGVGRHSAARTHRDRLRDRGVAFGVFIHDLFPISMPEVCAPGVAESFESDLREGIGHWDFVLANSQFTARTLQDYQSRTSRASPKILAVPLASQWDVAASTPGTSWPMGLESLKGSEFVLCVGTIEPRKNHRALIDAWAAIAKRSSDTPNLVLVGRRGWRVAPILRRLRGSGLLGRKIFWAEAVSDPQLAALYEACLFTVFPSLAEGWGLPVGESLSRGKVCVASNATAIPEAGGPLAVYFDPTVDGALERTLSSLLDDREALARREALIRTEFTPRTWADVARDLVDRINVGVGS